jgi:tetratricopeptide (TPR) repeat protein
MTVSKLRDQIFALIYSQMKPEQAVLRLNRILKATPEHSEALALKAYALNKVANSRKDWSYSKHALDSADRALALNPDDDIALLSKGWALIDLGRAVEALEPLQRATNMNPGNEYAWFNLAWAQYLTGNPTSSKESLERALQISPGNPIIKQGKRMMEKGQIPEHLKKKR